MKEKWESLKEEARDIRAEIHKLDRQRNFTSDQHMIENNLHRLKTAYARVQRKMKELTEAQAV